jgi:hypothetical protein
MSNPAEQPPQPNANAYLHAEYWDGAMFGVTLARTMTAKELDNSGWNFAEAHLEVFLQNRGNHVALQTLRDGQVWDATEQAPGTIVIMHQEDLTTLQRFDRAKIPELAAAHPVPERQIYVDEPFYSREGLVSYRRETAYGVVVSNKREGSNRMFQIPTNGLAPDRRGRMVVQPGQTARAATRTTVGSTRQVYGEDAKSEGLERVNLIEVIGAGVTRRRKRERLRWLPGLAPRPAGDM